MLILAGCLSIPTQQRVLVSNLVSHQPESTGECHGKNIAPNFQKKSVIERPDLDPTRISVLNWNIHKGRHQDWAADFKGYIQHHDIVTIQEAHLDDGLKSMLDKEHGYWALNTAFYFQGKATGVMTASRVRPVYNCGQHVVEPLYRLPKTSLISYYPIKGMDQNLLVANVHIINLAFGMAEYQEQIEKLYQAISKHRGPVVLAGDFNTWNDKRMRVVDNLAERLSLQSLDYVGHNRTKVFGNALDHVFYRDLEPVEHRTWHVTSSDHNPIGVTFRVK
ncbi:MAG: endonuclease/exonuclease/phosphatase family protein [Pseudomonadota bacterium]